MGQGQGSFQTNAKFPPGGSPGPPFLLTSANNGLSVDPISGKIVLGQTLGAVGDPAKLLDQRQIPLNGQSWRIDDTFGNRWLIVDAIAAHAEIGVHNGVLLGDDTHLTLDDGPFTFGWTLNTFNLTANTNITETADTVGNNYSIVSQGNRFLLLDFANNVYQLGDITGHTNKTRLTINDTAQTFELANMFGRVGVFDASLWQIFLGDLNDIVNGTQLELNDVNRSLNFADDITGLTPLSLNMSTGLYKIGDTTGAANNSRIIINDPGFNIIARVTDGVGEAFLELSDNVGTVHFRLRSDDGVTNEINLVSDSVAGTLLTTRNGFQYQSFDFTAKIFQLGDIGPTGNGAGLFINDTNKLVSLGPDIFGANTTNLALDGTAQQVNANAPGGFVVTGDTTLIHTGTTLSNNAGVSGGTLGNAPTAGDPSKWIVIDDNGTPRKIPTWL